MSLVGYGMMGSVAAGGEHAIAHHRELNVDLNVFPFSPAPTLRAARSISETGVRRDSTLVFSENHCPYQKLDSSISVVQPTKKGD
jgi:hypothetical protein